MGIIKINKMFLLLQLLNKGSLKPAGCPFKSDSQK